MTVLIPVRKTLGYAAVVLSLFFFFVGIGNSAARTDMATVESVTVSDTSAVLKIDSPDVSYDFYTLGAPPRLVLDVAGVLPLFEERTFDVGSGFSAIRVGIYAEKTRFVFDSASDQMPEAKVERSGNDLVVDWSGTAVVATKPRAEKPVSVTAINFDAENGASTFTVNFDGNFDLIGAEVTDDTIRFGAKDSVIPRSLRRVVDASVFPSSVLQITPYSTIIDGVRNVMFSAKMKGTVQYDVLKNGDALEFHTIDGTFAEAPAANLDTVYVPVDGSHVSPADSEKVMPSGVVEDGAGSDDVRLVINRLEGESSQGLLAAKAGSDTPQIYTGEPVTLVLEDADVRKVMQLIAEVSNLNLILSDDVEGTVSLRLRDVPWDQALDLILDIKQLGTISHGNVVRVLPLQTIKNMEAERLKAVKDIKKLEETRTEIFVVSYKDTDAIEDVIDDVLSNQGEVRVIEGSKKIMVNDIPSKLEEIRALIVELDEPVKQVMIEARIVEMRNTEGLDLGVNWGVSYTNDAGLKEVNKSLTRTLPSTSLDIPDFYPAGYYETTETVTREDGIQTVKTTYEGVEGTPTEDASYSTSDSSLIGIGTSTLNDMAVGLGGAFLLPSTLGTSGLGSVLTFGRTGVDSTIIDLRISALEASGDAKVVSSPKVLTLDGESARIEQGTSIPYQSVSDKGTTTEFEDATLSLEVTPEVNPDGSVILEILASNSSIGSIVATGAGSAPAIDTKEAETKLLLRNGETTVIGGIYVESEYSSNTGTPFLKDIPYLGKLFESNSNSRERSELLIFITPHVVD
ncbi:AMIN domain-containing protein [uncultured Desulfuromonas sp.]|uniref:AMIN domain-containing protein n=1 Tax=uncultured Desulfuromonas sp. TaxID=181013 RepID=UPI002AAB6186|nr:AMIN domain-containing protein [uncultured Desulfuromonas sp.]